MHQEQAQQMRAGQGFVAALDQSGGSTPKALKAYGIESDAFSNDDEMFALIHAMRARIVTSPAFTGDRVIGAILFEKTMDGMIEGKPSAAYLWDEKRVVPFLKVDKGLMEAENGCQLMKDMGDLESVLDRAVGHGIFGTKMRSVIGAANAQGIAANIAQQFEYGARIKAKGLMPILEPEVTISIDDKAETEDIVLAEITKHLDALPEGEEVMLKLSLPTKPNQYQPLIDHPRVMRVVALSGGYSRDAANALLAQNAGMIASFSRGLAEGLSAGQPDADFNATLEQAIEGIYRASIAGAS